MLRNYLKTSFRNLLKNPLASFINVFGLAVAIGTCMISYAYMSLELNMEGIHSKRANVFMVTSLVDRDGKAELYGPSPVPMGTKLGEDFPQIVHMSRVNNRQVVVKRGDQVFMESVRLVDPDYLQMLDFELIYGNRNALEGKNNVLISSEMAKKYFGDENPMGQSLQFGFAGGKKVSLIVQGVAEIDEMSSSFVFELLANFSLLEEVDDKFKETDWSKNIAATLFEVANPEDIDLIGEGASEYIPLVNSNQPDWQVQAFSFEPLSTLYDRSNDIRWDISRESDKEGQVVLSIIGLMMLALACLNYLNIAISSATKRLKEIGIRKVVGANRGMLIVQFIVENILLSFIALVMGVVLAKTFFLPGLNDLFAIKIRLNVLEAQFFIYLIGLLLFTSLASGAYPAIYISKFQSVTIFRGKLKFGNKSVLSKIFLALQFILACITVVCGITFTLNTQWQQEKPWGYNNENTMVVEVPDAASYNTLKNVVEQESGVIGLSGGSHHLGISVRSTIVQFPDRKMEMRRMDVADNYIETMDLMVVEGRDFRKDYESDREAVLINEKFAKQMNWADPIGQTFKYDSTSYSVIGVLKDFHYWDFWSDINPLFLRLAEEKDYRYMPIRVKAGQEIATYEKIEQKWSELFPELPFDGNYQSQLFQDYFRNVNGHKVLMTSVAIMALMLSCFGLYGLVALNVSGRIKEFSIRKVLGAGLGSLVKSISSHFILFMAVAMVIGGPLSLFLVNLLMDNIYTYHMPMTAMPVFIAIAFILITVILTISSQIRKVSKANPTDGLRIE